MEKGLMSNLFKVAAHTDQCDVSVNGMIPLTLHREYRLPEELSPRERTPLLYLFAYVSSRGEPQQELSQHNVPALQPSSSEAQQKEGSVKSVSAGVPGPLKVQKSC